jgi:glutamate decarboxylase
VDGASGGFVAPFVQPDLEWDFRLPRVQSINASGHKYGLVFPGVGWILWRDPDALPDDLVFNVNYLGGEMPTFALNFSRPGAQVCAQYYNFIRLGREGYTRVQQRSMDTARELAERIEAMPQFRSVTGELDMPVFAFALEDGIDRFTVFDVSRELRARGWQVPAYTMPANISDEAVLRIVVRNGFSSDLGDILMADLERAVHDLETHGGHPKRRHEAFRH